MIAVDTNILVRFVERAIETDERLFVPQIALCELVWVLSHAYKFNRAEILNLLQQLRRGAQITLERPDEVRRAIEAFAAGRGDFADYLIAKRSIASGCTSVVTFDRALHVDGRFSPPE